MAFWMWLLPLSVLFGSFLPLTLMVVVTLFCVTIMSGDIAYVLVRVVVPDGVVWTEAARTHRGLAWVATWLLQAPLWLRMLRSHSPLLLHEGANLLFTAQQAAVHILAGAGGAVPLPSAGLLASSGGGPPQRLSGAVGVAALLLSCAARCSLPTLYVACHGVPADWRQAICCLVAELGPMVLRELMLALGLSRAPRPEMFPWTTSYPPAHSIEGSDLDGECPEHGACAICWSNLCCPLGPASAAGAAAALRRRVAPGLSAARLAPGAPCGLSAARASPSWWGGRNAATECGHRFHLRCLSMVDSHGPAVSRCPLCRAALRGVAGAEGAMPSEEELDEQRCNILVGFSMGFVLLLVHAAGCEVRAPSTPLTARLHELLAPRATGAAGMAVAVRLDL